jgi:DNA polymerase III delta subunit-like protein
MNLPAAIEAARQGRLYPAVILYGGDVEARRQAAVELARHLLCAAAPAERPCGACRHCLRIAWPAAAGGSSQAAPFHPDFQVLERDLKTVTSVDATRELMRVAQVSPFEARGQVFVIASAESLSGEAANALLKNLEEPYVSAPRHFLLLAPSRLDLLPTLRSRSLAVFLGPAVTPDADRVEVLARAFAAAAGAYAETGAAVYLLSAAEALAAAGAAGAAGAARTAAAAAGPAGAAGPGRARPGATHWSGRGGGRGGGGAPVGWDDPRAGRPWELAAAAVLRSLPEPAEETELPSAPRAAPWRAARLALAEALLTGPTMRLRGISAERILEGLVSRHLSPLVPSPR